MTTTELNPIGKMIAAALPAGRQYDKGFRDALESMALALSEKMTQDDLRGVVQTALDAHANNVGEDDQAAALQGLKESISFATDSGLFDEMAGYKHPDVINNFCDLVNEVVAAQKRADTPRG
jgi:hypothetical protein